MTGPPRVGSPGHIHPHHTQPLSLLRIQAPAKVVPLRSLGQGRPVTL